MDDFRVDSFEWLSIDVFSVVLSLPDVASLASSVSVSRKWKSIAESDILWAKHCRELWKDKFIVRTNYLHQIEPRITAYSLSLEEGRREAGSYWVNCDPYWCGLHPMRRYFHRDGYVYADPDDPLWGGHECRWNFTKMHKERSSMVSVRINEWPPLKVSRTSCWGWRMENFMVVYQTSHPHETSRPDATVYNRTKF